MDSKEFQVEQQVLYQNIKTEASSEDGNLYPQSNVANGSNPIKTEEACSSKGKDSEDTDERTDDPNLFDLYLAIADSGKDPRMAWHIYIAANLKNARARTEYATAVLANCMPDEDWQRRFGNIPKPQIPVVRIHSARPRKQQRKNNQETLPNPLADTSPESKVVCKIPKTEDNPFKAGT